MQIITDKMTQRVVGAAKLKDLIENLSVSGTNDDHIKAEINKRALLAGCKGDWLKFFGLVYDGIVDDYGELIVRKKKKKPQLVFDTAEEEEAFFAPPNLNVWLDRALEDGWRGEGYKGTKGTVEDMLDTVERQLRYRNKWEHISRKQQKWYLALRRYIGTWYGFTLSFIPGEDNT